MPDTNTPDTPQSTEVTASSAGEGSRGANARAEADIDNHWDGIKELCAEWCSPLLRVWAETAVADNGVPTVCIMTALRDGIESMPFWFEPTQDGAWEVWERGSDDSAFAQAATLPALMDALRELPGPWPADEADEEDGGEEAA